MQPGGANVQPTTSPLGLFGGRARSEEGTVNHQMPEAYIDIDHANALKDDLTIVVSPAFGQAGERQQDPTHVRFLLRSRSSRIPQRPGAAFVAFWPALTLRDESTSPFRSTP